eukprot:TRINITY_DN900_c1_g1_i2.p1 TRINITY_DN900_c1_g1~~TRINITY_DN900_c1_g1_i2.p1  ORF type:complete len:217 (+),score=33.77 TRINITY_DN900_c1_g1_i2:96-746(+)
MVKRKAEKNDEKKVKKKKKEEGETGGLLDWETKPKSRGNKGKMKPKSIYAPYNPKAPKKTKKSLRWVDMEKDGGKLCSACTYYAPWGKNKENWWQRAKPLGVTFSWSAHLAPGKKKTLRLDVALQQSLHLTCATTFTLLGEEKAVKGEVARVLLAPVQVSCEGEEPNTPHLIAVLPPNSSSPLKLIVSPGEYQLTNDGKAPIVVTGLVESLYIRMK